MNYNLTDQARESLIAWAVQALARWVGEDASSLVEGLKANTSDFLTPFGRLLNSGWSPEGYPEGRLLFTPSLVKPADGDELQPVSLPRRPLALERSTILHEGEDDRNLWHNFATEFRALQSVSLKEPFEGFTYLFHKYAWAAPCTYGEIGVSLYEEFKALAAVVHASGGGEQPAEKFLLVGGDTSGIQDFLYTITHKAAAKGLRGRSFFLQLLSDATVRAILRELDLPWTNVVYVAGGNFLILAPASQEVEERLECFVSAFNHTLLKVARSELNLVLGWAPIAAAAVGDPAAWREGVRQVKEKQAQAKTRPFADVARKNWGAVFGPTDEGGKQYCAICHCGLREGEGKVLEREEGREILACDLCYSFGDLAEKIRYDDLWMIVEPCDAKAVKGRAWSDALVRLSGFRYWFAHGKPQVTDEVTVYAVNQLDFLAPEVNAHGFRLLANVTPRMTQKDIKWAEGEGLSFARPPEVGDVRDFDMLAQDARGVKWVGVLRMDVDDLGAVFTQWGPKRALAGTSALSSSMELFFGGWLNEAVKDECGNSAYVIYAGGDDLFIVGAWDGIVALAERIRNDFHQYTGGNPHLTISAGISLMERAKFPLYLAAEQAHQALDGRAKAGRWELLWESGRILEREARKNAICFLDTVVGWERWPKVKEIQKELVRLCSDGVPRALIQTVRNIHAQYERGRREYEKELRKRGRRSEELREYPFFHGRWMWLAAYQLSRMAEQHRWVAERLKTLQRQIVQPEIAPYSGLAARWAEYLMRGREEQ
jgi:CRISPR-associated protein Csm1